MKRSSIREVLRAGQAWAVVLWASLLVAPSQLGRRLRDETGATTLEYGLLILMAVVVLAAAIQTLGGGITTFFSKLTKSITSLN